MPISFRCKHCGKKLKAPDQAAGKSSTCPGCGGLVTCPEAGRDSDVVEMTIDPVVEMTLEPAEPSGLGPYADLDQDTAYAVTGPEQAADAMPEQRRPCPKCGEMILTTAAKCRFCGEVFDPVLRKAKKGTGGKKARLRSIAVLQKGLLLSIVSVILLSIILGVINGAMRQSPEAGINPLALLLSLVVLCASLSASVFTLLLANKVYNIGVAILVLLLSFIPCFGLIAMLVVNQKATRMLREKGIEVGFLGASLSQF
jgi:hypothetical protein